MKRSFCCFILRDLLRPLLIALALWPALGHPADWDIDQLMQELGQTRSGRASFVESKSIAMLDKPVVSSGELFFSAPDRLEKHTIKPKPEVLILDRDTLTLERGRQKHIVQLQDYPELAAFIASIRGTLAGDRMALERAYRLSLEGTRLNWTLQLTPLAEKMQAVVTRIRIAGAKATVSRIEIIQADGDSSLMLIEKIVTPP